MWNVSSIVLNSLSLTIGEGVVAVDVVVAVVVVADLYSSAGPRIPPPFCFREQSRGDVAVAFATSGLPHDDVGGPTSRFRAAD